MKKITLFLFMGFTSFVNLYAQCAMCKETVANSTAENGQDYGAGLNSGILWLMAFPYILFIIIGSLVFYAYKKRKKKTELEQIIG